jgi:hypothetical protein
MAATMETPGKEESADETSDNASLVVTKSSRKCWELLIQKDVIEHWLIFYHCKITIKQQKCTQNIH